MIDTLPSEWFDCLQLWPLHASGLTNLTKNRRQTAPLMLEMSVCAESKLWTHFLQSFLSPHLTRLPNKLKINTKTLNMVPLEVAGWVPVDRNNGHTLPSTPPINYVSLPSSSRRLARLTKRAKNKKNKKIEHWIWQCLRWLGPLSQNNRQCCILPQWPLLSILLLFMALGLSQRKR